MERKVVIVVPTFNEQDNIESFFRSVLQNDVEILVVDSQSKDDTISLVKKATRQNKKIHLLMTKEPGPGKLGLGLSEGINFAFKKLHADVVVTMEADLSNDPSQIGSFLKKAKRADLVVGSRYISGGKIVNWSWWRKLLSRGANIILMLLVGTTRLHEFTNLYRAFNQKTWAAIANEVSIHTGWLFVPAFVFVALEKKLLIVEQPIIYYDRYGGRSKMNTLSYTKNLLRYALRSRWQKSASFLKFLIVGGLGFAINTVALLIGVRLELTPANAGVAGAELAIISNFTFNNLWTFSDRKLSSWQEIPGKFIQFNLLSLGSVVIQYLSLRVGEFIFGLTRYKSSGWYLLFYIAGVGLGLIWNYFMYSRVIWKKK